MTPKAMKIFAVIGLIAVLAWLGVPPAVSIAEWVQSLIQSLVSSTSK